jgi:hypothetical protein
MEACINVSMVVRGPFYSVNQAGDPFVYEISHGELERDYENIPEPRKPREWLLRWSPDGERTWIIDGGFAQSDNDIRVIEWPENAPLPDWPE